jgi:hypothetical protein
MTTELDWRLEAAIRPLVTERVAPSVITDLEGVGVDPRSTRAPRISQTLVVAAVLLALLVATFALVWSAGGPKPVLSARDIAMAAANGAPLVMTADGPVYLHRPADRSRIELLLQPETGDPLVLASIADPESQTGGLDWIPVFCPPSTGLRHERYLLGQAVGFGGPIFLQGIRGQAAGPSDKMYLIAVDDASPPTGEWKVSFVATWGTAVRSEGDHWSTYRVGGRGLRQSPAGCLSE